MKEEGLSLVDWAVHALVQSYITSGGSMAAVVAAVKKEKGG